MTKSKENLDKIIESLLFASGEALSISKIAKITKKSESSILKSLEDLKKRLRDGSGLRILMSKNKAQLVTGKEYAPFTEKLFKSERKEELTKAALEVLAIVAYNGPVTRGEIEVIRGVNSAFILRSLLIRGLIERVGNEGSRGLYQLSLDSLKKFGLEKQEDLPHWQQIQNEIQKVKEAFASQKNI